jgi:hypothetical protein
MEEQATQGTDLKVRGNHNCSTFSFGLIFKPEDGAT